MTPFSPVLTMIILIGSELTLGGGLWCYECNTNLTEGHQGGCNDPYTPGPAMNLVQCPQDESQQCLKSVIFYGNILVTVRGCVPSRMVEDYCQLEDQFPDSIIECLFCKGYACNRSWRSSTGHLTLLIAVLVFILH